VYPLNSILIGSNEDLRRQARIELWNHSVQLEAEFSSVGDATDALRKSSTEKRLLFIQIASASDFEALGRLTSQFPNWPVVALVEEYDKASLGEIIIGILRAGASQILALPIQPKEFEETLDRIATQFVYTAKKAKVIAVAGVTGGSGATTVALNLAFEIADRHGLRCVLADLSLRMGMVAPHLNLKPSNTINDLLRDTNRIDTHLAKQALIRVADNFDLLPGPHELLASVTTSAKDVACVVDTLKQLADVVVLDVPCTYDDIYFETLAAADRAIMIGEQKLSSVRALKMVREAINRVAGTEYLVVNRFDPKNTGFGVKNLLAPLGVSTLHTVARDDVGMSNAVEKACTLRFAAPRSPALADIVALADTVLALDPAVQIKPAGLFRRLGRALINS